MASGGRPVNKNTSTSGVTRAEKAQINELQVVCEISKASRSNRSGVWRHYGALHHSPDATSTNVIDDERLYCRCVKYLCHANLRMAQRLCSINSQSHLTTYVNA